MYNGFGETEEKEIFFFVSLLYSIFFFLIKIKSNEQSVYVRTVTATQVSQQAFKHTSAQYNEEMTFNGKTIQKLNRFS